MFEIDKINDIDTNRLKSRLVVSILTITVVSLVLLMPSVYATHSSVTTALNSDTDVNFRDISFFRVPPAPSQIATISVDDSTAGNGFITITVEEVDKNLRLDKVDSVNVDVINSFGTHSVVLLESDTNTGTFSGRVNLVLSSSTGNNVQVGDTLDPLDFSYDPEPQSVGRFFAELGGVTGDGTVEISDYTEIVDKELYNCDFKLATLPVFVDLEGGAAVSDITVTLSYENANLASLPAPFGFPDPSFLQVLYAPHGTTSFQSLTGFAAGGIDLSGHSPIGVQPRSVTSLIQPPNPEGDYALGFASAICPGGGGGGLVRPGLVVNVLAGSGSIASFFSGFGGGGGGTAVPLITGSTLFLEPEAGITLLEEKLFPLVLQM